MKLLENWEEILRKAWSMKMLAASIIFGVLEGLIQALLFFGQLPDWMPVGLFLGVSIVSSAGASVLRLMQQPGGKDGT